MRKVLTYFSNQPKLVNAISTKKKKKVSVLRVIQLVIVINVLHVYGTLKKRGG